MFNQTFQFHDLLLVALLVIMEGALSIDNALVLGLLARRLPRPLQRKALTYGLAGAIVFRFIAVLLATKLLEWRIVKLLGGLYLIFIAIKHLFFENRNKQSEAAVFDHPDDHPAAFAAAMNTHSRAFWASVAAIELTDIAFAVDSILAAIALVGEAPEGAPPGQWHPKLWVIITGGLLGVMLMRFAATVFIRLLDHFPRFELSAYLLVSVIGVKLLVDWAFNADRSSIRFAFHDPHAAVFWIFWSLMGICFAIGFLPKRSAR